MTTFDSESGRQSVLTLTAPMNQLMSRLTTITSMIHITIIKPFGPLLTRTKNDPHLNQVRLSKLKAGRMCRALNPPNITRQSLRQQHPKSRTLSSGTRKQPKEPQSLQPIPPQQVHQKYQLFLPRRRRPSPVSDHYHLTLVFTSMAQMIHPSWCTVQLIRHNHLRLPPVQIASQLIPRSWRTMQRGGSFLGLWMASWSTQVTFRNLNFSHYPKIV